MVIYGNKFGGDALWNIRLGVYGTEVSFRFIAKDDVPVNKIRWFNTYSLERSGYHGGSGGKVMIQLKSDDQTTAHFPYRTLAYARLPNPLEAPKFPIVEFDKTVVLKKDKVYHIVFSNYDIDPEINFVSVNTMFVMAAKPIDSPDHPDVSPTDMTVLFRSKYNGWKRFKDDLSVTPIFTLYYNVSEMDTDEISVVGYGGMEAWVREPRTISGQSMVRQRFIPKQDGEFNSLMARLRKVDGSDNVSVGIFKGNEKISEGTLDKSNIPDIMGWVKTDLPCSLTAGVEHSIVLSSSGNYETFPTRDGSQFGFSSSWDGNAEYTTDGVNWKGWDVWGNSNVKFGDLQMYLKKENIK